MFKDLKAELNKTKAIQQYLIDTEADLADILELNHKIDRLSLEIMAVVREMN